MILPRELIELGATLDRIGFDIGTHRVSVWSGLLVFVVLLGVILFACA